VDDQTIRIFLNHNVTGSKVKDALTQALALKAKVAQTQRELAHVNNQLREITQDQGRLRANLKEMPPTAAAYKRYLEKFDKQETEIEQLQDKIKQLQGTEYQQKTELDNYLINLSVE
jgi:septal ring factor EnvC (AmiA/AmiB activator)